nr:hypothetical protein GCM10020093_009660 [Planobispora longispora]
MKVLAKKTLARKGTPDGRAEDRRDALGISGLSLAVGTGERAIPCSPTSPSGWAGETVGLVGESGSGKSLTARAALGMLPRGARATGGVTVADVDVLAAGRRQLRDLRRTRASMIFQDPRASINPVRRIGDYLTEGLRARGVPARAAAERARDLLDQVGIRDPKGAMRRFPHEFSGGMLQRVVIAGALSTEPELLLADEPTTALDVTTQAEVVGLLKDMQRVHGTGMLFVTHDLDLAAAICDRVYVMYAGRIVEEAASASSSPRPRTRTPGRCWRRARRCTARRRRSRPSRDARGRSPNRRPAARSATAARSPATSAPGPCPPTARTGRPSSRASARNR